LTLDELVAEFDLAASAIEAVTGVRPSLVRPPYGKRARDLAATLPEGESVVLWSLDSGDTAGFDAARVGREVVDHARPGDIVLLHDGGSHRPVTLEAVAAALETLTALGYRFVTVSELLS
jgi:peptidoglycan/xylan/chitin deacetylase (PgdA/CDA1 family)